MAGWSCCKESFEFVIGLANGYLHIAEGLPKPSKSQAGHRRPIERRAYEDDGVACHRGLVAEVLNGRNADFLKRLKYHELLLFCLPQYFEGNEAFPAARRERGAAGEQSHYY